MRYAIARFPRTARALALAFDALVAFLVVAGCLWITIDMSTGLVPVDALNHQADARGG